MEPQRYFIGYDCSSHEYLVPWSKADEWRIWANLPEDDEASWDVPEYAERLDGGILTFTDPKVL